MNVVDEVYRSDLSRTEVAHKMSREAVDNLRKVEADVRRTFDQLIKASEEMQEVGVTVSFKMMPELAMAFEEYKKG
jgi:hypothetical protein